jgi:hypothetical protein
MTDAGASSSKAKAKASSPNKERNRPYMSVEIVQALYDQNSSVGLRDVHLPSGWHLTARRVPIALVPRHGRARRDEIRRRQVILPLDLRDDPAFDMDSEWWDRPAYEPCLRRRLGLLLDTEYDYDADPYLQQQVPHWVPLPPEEDEEEEEQVVEAPVLPVEQTSRRNYRRRRPS